jgi:WD40 repeat protein
MRMRRWPWVTCCLCVFMAFVSMNISPAGMSTADDQRPEGNKRRAGHDVSVGRQTAIIPIGHSVGVDTVAFAPDGTLIASGNVDNLVRLWQAQSGKVWRTLRGHSSGVTSVAFSPDSTLLASGSWDGTVRLWQVQTGMELRTLTGHDNLVSSGVIGGVFAGRQPPCQCEWGSDGALVAGAER